MQLLNFVCVTWQFLALFFIQIPCRCPDHTHDQQLEISPAVYTGRGNIFCCLLFFSFFFLIEINFEFRSVKNHQTSGVATGSSRGGGQSATPDSEKKCQTSGKRGKNREEKVKIGKVLSLCPS